jgi:DNA-binding beta-propeller fold protein YncE
VFGPDNDAYAAIGRPYNQIRRYDGASGGYKGVFASEGLDHPFGLTFGPDSDLYVVSQLNDKVLRYDGDTGQLIGPLPTGNCTIHEPHG